MTLEGEAELIALALVRLDLARTEQEPHIDEANQLLQDLVDQHGVQAVWELVAVLVHLEANALTCIARDHGRPVAELVDDLELQDFLQSAGEH